MDDSILRCFNHDYRSRCIYMITIKKDASAPIFGRVTGDATIPLHLPGSPRIAASWLGKMIVAERALLEKHTPGLKVLHYALMPDHIHLLIFVQQPTKEHLGIIIARFKHLLLLKAKERNFIKEEDHLFTPSYNDRILFKSIKLQVIINYMKENPYRYQARKQFPDFFTRTNRIVIEGEICDLYGNLQLLYHPFKYQVVVHRRDPAETKERNFHEWRRAILNNDVVIGPFISINEKKVLKEALSNGGKVIYVKAGKPGERFKPYGKLFNHCVKGKLLIVFSHAAFEKMEKSHPPKLTRESCKIMNELALKITSLGAFCQALI